MWKFLWNNNVSHFIVDKVLMLRALVESCHAQTWYLLFSQHTCWLRFSQHTMYDISAKNVLFPTKIDNLSTKWKIFRFNLKFFHRTKNSQQALSVVEWCLWQISGVATHGGSILSTLLTRDMSQRSKFWHGRFHSLSVVTSQYSRFPRLENILVELSRFLSVATCSRLSLSKKKTVLPLIDPSNTVSQFGKSTDSAGPFLEVPSSNSCQIGPIAHNSIC